MILLRIINRLAEKMDNYIDMADVAISPVIIYVYECIINRDKIDYKTIECGLREVQDTGYPVFL